MQEIVQALKEKLFIVLSFTMHGSQIQVCGTARSEKGKISSPMNFLVSADELENSLKSLLESWGKEDKEEKEEKPKKLKKMTARDSVAAPSSAGEAPAESQDPAPASEEEEDWE